MALNIDNSKGELVIDPYKNKERYKSWDKKIENISKENCQAIVMYLEDMRKGININPKAMKGKRGYHRLNNQKHRLSRVFSLLEKHYGIKNVMVSSSEDIKRLKEKVGDLFEKIEEGEIKKTNGEKYTSVRDYIKGFKAWWHWHITYCHNEFEKTIPDICEYMTVKDDRKPHYVYFGEIGGMSVEEGFKKMLNAAKPEYKIVMAFLLDSGIRCPTELMNIKRKDITPIKDKPFLALNIRDETTKTFGRNIKLMLCHDLLKDYLEGHKFKPEDFIFQIKPYVVNKYIKRLGYRVLGKGNALKDKKGKIISISNGITMYDFRHNSACYWLSRYKSEPALMYRFGWKDSKMIHYYTEFLGRKDTIQEEDLMVDITKVDLQRNLEQETREREILEDQVITMGRDFDKFKTGYKVLDKLGELKPDLKRALNDKALLKSILKEMIKSGELQLK